MADATGAISYVGGTSRLWTRRGFLMGHRSKVAAEPVCEAVGVFHLSIRNWQSELQGDGDGPAPVGEHSRIFVTVMLWTNIKPVKMNVMLKKLMFIDEHFGISKSSQKRFPHVWAKPRAFYMTVKEDQRVSTQALTSHVKHPKDPCT
ncbi:PREDICTED: uncharacterized protein LOC102019690 isoform X2 [Chinchilla lanigera]|uniref:uncharacterized protein LOC102019690 isoform X2 n=1 Tax=Chinchilla lanigera TaxID=34839 RepID=UPI0006987372|nr:PREDICTED: uncharacterized protein LOC102019690 isoform X2 [Chinchilla lanigera]